ncbi:MAG: methyltransferase domain-containing protein [Gammaproteobacteria bacterium]|nr:methyltransferase domain-containing protein [Gammaproteobacteria bacterium]
MSVNIDRLITQNKFKEAIALIEQNLQLNPLCAHSYRCLAQCLNKLKYTHQAIQTYERCIELEPHNVDIHIELANLYLEVKDASSAYSILFDATKRAPDNINVTNGLINVLSKLSPQIFIPEIQEGIIHCLNSKSANVSVLGWLCGNQLKLSPELKSPVLISNAKHSQLLLSYLSTVINTDLELEQRLIQLREQLLKALIGGCQDTDTLKLACAMCLQCFHNEYVFHISELELTQLIDYQTKAFRNLTELATYLLTLCMYEQPSIQLTPIIESLLVSEYSDLFEDIAKKLFHEPLKEKQLRSSIETKTSISNTVSQLVKSQYEQNPYPRWQVNNQVNATKLFRTEHNVNKPQLAVLIAGCGTGFEPVELALLDNSLDITAMDLSVSSLAYGKRKALEHQLTNIRFVQGDILNVHELNISFDVILCTGVLHHMESPEIGFESLTKCLSPNGIFQFALYSEMARQPVVYAQDLIKREGLFPCLADIKQLRQQVINAPKNSELFKLQYSDDFYSVSGCRDLCFNYVEHRFDLLKIDQMMSRHGITFTGLSNVPNQVFNAFKEQYPEIGSERDFKNWHQFEQMHSGVFSGMYHVSAFKRSNH